MLQGVGRAWPCAIAGMVLASTLALGAGTAEALDDGGQCTILLRTATGSVTKNVGVTTTISGTQYCAVPTAVPVTTTTTSAASSTSSTSSTSAAPTGAAGRQVTLYPIALSVERQREIAAQQRLAQQGLAEQQAAQQRLADQQRLAAQAAQVAQQQAAARAAVAAPVVAAPVVAAPAVAAPVAAAPAVAAPLAAPAAVPAAPVGATPLGSGGAYFPLSLAAGQPVASLPGVGDPSALQAPGVPVLDLSTGDSRPVSSVTSADPIDTDSHSPGGPAVIGTLILASFAGLAVRRRMLAGSRARRLARV